MLRIENCDLLFLHPKDMNAGGMAELDEGTLKMMFEIVIEADEEIRVAVGNLNAKIDKLAPLVTRVKMLQKHYNELGTSNED